MNRKYQIFIGSTYDNLLEERCSVIDTIMRLGHIPTGTEFCASAESTPDIIKSMIDESDCYLLIIGNKYESVSESDIRYTEWEYDYAASIGKYIIAFLYRDSENPSDCEKENNDIIHCRLSAFFNKVKSSHTAEFWHDKTDLVKGISSEINKMASQSLSETCWIHINEKNRYYPADTAVTADATIELLSSLSEQCGTYHHLLSDKSLSLQEINHQTLSLSLSLEPDCGGPYQDAYTSCYVQLLPQFRNWTNYILDQYYLCFECTADTMVSYMWLEIRGYGHQIHRQFLFLEENRECHFCIELQQCLKEINDIDNWRNIKELCFIFRPGITKTTACITIKNIRLERF